jgi:hypothetical protein
MVPECFGSNTLVITGRSWARIEKGWRGKEKTVSAKRQKKSIPKVRHFRIAIFVDENISGCQVFVDNVFS